MQTMNLREDEIYLRTANVGARSHNSSHTTIALQITSCLTRRTPYRRFRRQCLRHSCLRLFIGRPICNQPPHTRWPFSNTSSRTFYLLLMRLNYPAILLLAWSTHAYPFRVRLHVASLPCGPVSQCAGPVPLPSLRLIPLRRPLLPTLKEYVEGGSRRHIAPVKRCCRRPPSERCR